MDDPTPRTLWADTRDGLRLAVHHIPAPEPRAAALLLHGLGANRHTFDFPGRSVADYLAGRGVSAFVPELRGAGLSDLPATPWILDDYLRLDLPAILDTVTAESGSLPLAWVGHSMGGLLLWLYAIENPGVPIHRGVTVGSALDYRVGGTDFRKLLRLRSVLEGIPRLPWGRVMRRLSPLTGRVSTPWERFNLHPSNMEADIVRTLFAQGFGDLSMPLMAGLATTFEERGLRDATGHWHYLDHVDRIRFPVAVVGGSRDLQCPLESTGHTAGVLPQGEHWPFGRAFGHADEYGHFDLLLGRRAEVEIWPRLARFVSGS